MKTFAELLSLYINQAGITDSELSRAIGVSRQSIFRWREGTTSRPNNREVVLTISEKLRLTPEEKDNLLLAAGFRPEDTLPPDKGATATGYTDEENEEENDPEYLLVRSGKRKLFVSRRFIVLIIIILVFIVIMALIDWLQIGSYDPF
jgi:transcriptional regulator with XRE-family HTH domain